MGLNGGGYTFVRPQDLDKLSDRQVQQWFTDKKTLLMRLRKCDGTQPYSVLSQLKRYSHIPLKFALNDYTGYAAPVNKALGHGSSYLYTGFLPKHNAANHNIQGFKSNGKSITFKNCNKKPNSEISFFTNYHEKKPSNHLFGKKYPLVSKFLNSFEDNYSTRLIDPSYFVFFELNQGGCGGYTQTDGRLRKDCVLGGTIGFR